VLPCTSLAPLFLETVVTLLQLSGRVWYNSHMMMCEEKGEHPMASIEERLTALEQENVALKKSVELQMIALRALVTKDAFEALRDTNNKIFDVLMSHDQLTNERLGDLQTQVIGLDGKIETQVIGLDGKIETQVIGLDGKIVGLQTETRQRFDDLQTQVIGLDGKIVGLQTETRQRFDDLQTQVIGLDGKIETQVIGLDGKIVGLQTETRQRFDQQGKLLLQILDRLPSS
jgi:hypothetical protein